MLFKNYFLSRIFLIAFLGLITSPNVLLAQNASNASYGWNVSYWDEHRPGIRLRATIPSGADWPYEGLNVRSESEYFLNFVLNQSTNDSENLAPIARADEASVVSEYEIVVAVLQNDQDPDGAVDETSVVIVTQPSAGVAEVLTDGSVLYAHDGSAVSEDSFSYQVSDNLGMVSNVAHVSITIEPIAAPVAVEDSAIVGRSESVTIDVIGNDISNTPLDLSSLVAVFEPSHAKAFLVNSDGSITYEHDGTATVSDYFVYRVENSHSMQSNDAVVNIQIEGDFPPVANDDVFTVKENTSTALSVLANDLEPDGVLDISSIEIINLPTSGTAVSQADGTVLYTHSNGVSADSFSYAVFNADGVESNEATVSIVIEPVLVGDPPVSSPDVLQVVGGVTGSLNVLSNDTDLDDDIDADSVVIVVEPSHGEVIVKGGGIVEYEYDSTATSLHDVFSYRVFDDKGNESNLATVTVTIVLPSEAPVAKDDMIDIARGDTAYINVLSNDSDLEDDIDVSSVTIIADPVYGTALVRNTGIIEYIHESSSDASADSLTYAVFDADGNESNVARVDIRIEQDSISKLFTISELIYEGAFKMPGTVYGESRMNYAQGPLEVNGSRMFITGHAQDDAIAEFELPNLVNSTNLDELNLSAEPVQSFSTILDRAAGGNPDTLDIITGLEIYDGGLVVNAIEFNDASNSSTTSTLYIDDASALDVSEVSAIHSLHGVARSAGWISSIPIEWQNALEATHISGSSSGLSFISRMSVGPSAFAVTFGEYLKSNSVETISATELQGFSYSVPLHEDLANDSRTNDLWTVMSEARYGFIVPGTDTYMTLGSSGGHYSGTGSGITQDDGNECSGTCSYAADDVYNFYWLWDVNEWLRVKAGEILPSDLRPYEYGELNIPFQGGSELYKVGGASYDEESGLLYVNVLEANSDSNFQKSPVIVAYRLIDDSENIAPVASNDFATVTAGYSVRIDALSNDSDIGGALDSGSVIVTTDPTFGSVVVQADGSFLYTHNGNGVLPDSFTYQVFDNRSLISNVATVSITVEPISPPVAIDDEVVIARGASVVINLLNNDLSNTPLDEENLLIIVGPSHTQNFELRSDGTVLYTHDGTENLSDGLVYQVRNIHSMWSNEANLTITIEGYAPPVANDDSVTVAENSSTVISVLQNDSGSGSPLDSKTVEIVEAPKSGSAIPQADGGVLYTNTNGSSDEESDSFTYTVLNEEGRLSNIATVNVRLEQVITSSAPVAVADEVTVSVNSAVRIDVLSNDYDENNSIDSSTLSVLTEPTDGAYVITDGEIEYSHLGGVASSDFLTYTVENDEGFVSNAASVNISLQPEIQPGNIIFETDFSEDTDYSVQSINLWNDGFNTGIYPPVGWDGVKASHNSTVSVISGAGENGGNALKLEWDPDASQPTVSLGKHLTGDEETGFDELYIRYNVKLPNNFMVGDYGVGADYWKWGRLWQNTSVDHTEPNKWTENRENSGYVLFTYSGSPPYSYARSTWAEPGGVNLDKGSAGGARQRVDYFDSDWDSKTSAGSFERLWEVDENGRLVENNNQGYHTIEFRFRMATSETAADGVFEIWLDGVPQGGYKRINNYGGAEERSGIPTVRIGSGWNYFVLFDNLGGWNERWGDPSVDGFVYINDVVISDRYIGPDYRVGQ